MVPAPPKVFISYSHDSVEHAQHVLELAERLRADGIDAQLDQYVAGTPAGGWPRWMEDQLDSADFVLLLCTETYYRRFRGQEQPEHGRGVDSEGSLVTNEVYQDQSLTTKFLPLLFSPSEAKFIPTPLLGHAHYVLDTEENYIRLHEFLTGQSGVVPRGLGPLKKWARKQGKLLKKLLKRLTFNESGRSHESDQSCGDLHGVPDLPPHYLLRDDVLIGLKRKLLGGAASIPIGGQGQALGVEGMGGIGKTVLAASLARDSEVRQAFPDGVYWITIGQRPNLLELQNQLLRQLAGSRELLTTEQEAKDALRKALEGRSALVVVDDAWKIDHANAFSVTARPARLLITTRNQEVLIGLGAEEHRVDVLSPSDALKMLTEWVGEKCPDKLPSEAAEVAKECGNLPLALAMIGAMIRSKLSSRPTSESLAWKDALTRLRRADLGAIKKAFPNYPYPDLLVAMQVSIDALEESDRKRYLDLAVFYEDQSIPEEPLRVLWNLDEVDTRDCMTRLVARSLATRSDRGVSEALILHDLQRDLIYKRREKDLPRLHLRLVEAWDALRKLDSFAWRWVGYHMVKAECNNDLRRLLLDFDYLRAKLVATDTNALIADYDCLRQDKDLQLVQSAIRLSSNVLARDSWQLAGQLTGRLLNNTSPSIQAMLKQAVERNASSWLRPLNSSLTAPGGPLTRAFEGYISGVNAVAVTADGRQGVSGSSEGTLRLWDLDTGQTLRTLEGHISSVTGVAITSDGLRAVSASVDRTLRLWDLESGRTLCALQGHMSSVNAVAVTPDGRRALSGSDDRTLRLWDLKSGQTLRTLEGPTWSVLAVAVTPDGCWAVSAHADLTLWLWDLSSGQTLRIFEGHKGKITAVAITSDGRRAVSASWDRTLRLWDLNSGQALRTLEGHRDRVTAVATSDGLRAVSGSDDQTLRLWDLESGKTICTLEGHMGAVTAVAITSDGLRAVSASDDRTLRLWDLESSQTSSMLEGHTDSVNAVTITSNGLQAVSASRDKTLRLWDLESGQALRTFEGHTDRVNGVAIMSDGLQAVSCSNDQTLRVWDLESGQTLRTLQGHTSSVRSVVLISGGFRAVSASDDQTLRLWDLESGQTLRTLEGHTGSVRSVVVISGGRALSDSWDLTLRLWDLESGKTIRTLEGHKGLINAITSDEFRVVSASDDGTLRVWDLESGQTLRTLQGHANNVWAVAVTPDGRRVVSASEDRTLRLWDLESGQTIRMLEGHTDAVWAAMFMPDGLRVVSASRDQTLRVWDLESGKEIAAFTGESGMLNCAITPDGRTIVAGDELGRVHFVQLVDADDTKPSIGDTKLQLLHREEPLTDTPDLQTGKEQPMPNDSKTRVFMSHSSKDKAFVRKLIEALNKRLLNIWVDEHEIRVGDSLVGKISEALKNADYLVIVLSQASVSSRWVEQELNASLTNQISGRGVVLPVLLEDCELPMLLRDRLYADFRADFNVGLEALVAAFEHEGEAVADVATLGPRIAAPASFTPSMLRETFQGLLTDRMSRPEIARLWYGVLETRMDDEMGQRPKSDCVIELLEQAKSRNKLPRLTEELRKIRPDLVDP